MSCDSGRAQCFAAIEATGKTPVGTLEATYQQAVSFETFAGIHGAGKFAFSEPALHRRAGANATSWKRLTDRQLIKTDEWQQKRDALRELYDQKIAANELRPPTEMEILARNAEGHSDNESVLAARRVLAKRFARNPEAITKYPAIWARVQANWAKVDVEEDFTPPAPKIMKKSLRPKHAAKRKNYVLRETSA
ncbi:MAG: hypothetical protein AAB571_06030 [Chloroflexota bacterium]